MTYKVFECVIIVNEWLIFVLSQHFQPQITLF